MSWSSHAPITQLEELQGDELLPPPMSFELTENDLQQLAFARCHRFDEVLPKDMFLTMVHGPNWEGTLQIIGGDREASWLLENAAHLRFWAWVTLGVDHLILFNEDTEIYSQPTFPFFECRVKSGLKLKKRSRLRIPHYGNRNSGTNDRNHSEWG